MFYFILAAVTIFILVLIFRDDHDRSYDKRDNSMRTYRPENLGPVPKKSTPAKKTRQVEPQRPEKITAEQLLQTIQPELSWTYLDALEYYDDADEDTFDTEITGMRHYCSLSDVGPVNGAVMPEPNNPHDPRAQVVIRADGKKLGYIPRLDLDEYEEFNPDNHVCPFAGKVTVDKKGYMTAEILVAAPVSRDFVKEELTYYVE